MISIVLQERIIQLIKDLDTYHAAFFPVLRCLHTLAAKLPGYPLGKQVCLSIRLETMETIINRTFAHGYKLSKYRFQIALTLLHILIYRSKWGFSVAPHCLFQSTIQLSLFILVLTGEGDILSIIGQEHIWDRWLQANKRFT